MNFEQLLSSLTPEIVASMKRAVELGKWPDGRALTAAQREQSLQAVMAWEAINVPEDQRTGYMAQSCQGGKPKASLEESSDETILRFQDA